MLCLIPDGKNAIHANLLHLCALVFFVPLIYYTKLIMYFHFFSNIQMQKEEPLRGIMRKALLLRVFVNVVI
jgi:hypothetical protein